MRHAIALAIATLAACGGSQDAPRPIEGSQAFPGEDPGGVTVPPDDDGDGVPNDADLCPHAREPYSGGTADGCPDTPGPDAGA
jgi:hypothetical protein